MHGAGNGLNHCSCLIAHSLRKWKKILGRDTHVICISTIMPAPSANRILAGTQVVPARNAIGTFAAVDSGLDSNTVADLDALRTRADCMDSTRDLMSKNERWLDSAHTVVDVYIGATNTCSFHLHNYFIWLWLGNADLFQDKPLGFCQQCSSHFPHPSDFQMPVWSIIGFQIRVTLVDLRWFRRNGAKTTAHLSPYWSAASAGRARPFTTSFSPSRKAVGLAAWMTLRPKTTPRAPALTAS